MDVDVGSDTERGSNGTSDRSDTAETMILDRASDSYEFKGRLKLEVGSDLRALRLPAIVPLPQSDPAHISEPGTDREIEQQDVLDEDQEAVQESNPGTDHGAELHNEEDEALNAGLFDLPELTQPVPETKSNEPSADHPETQGLQATSRTVNPGMVWLDGCVAEVDRKDGCISCLTILTS